MLACICSVQDCHVLTFTSAGTVADHLVLHPSLETGNFIIKVVLCVIIIGALMLLVE